MAKEVTATAEILATKRGDFFKIDPRNIEVIPGFNLREDMGDLAVLKEQIRENGVLTPLKLRKKKNDTEKFELIQGHRRHMVAMELIAEGIQIRVPAFLEDKVATEVDRYVDMLIANEGKPLTAIEASNVVARLLKVNNLTEDEVAKKIGRTITYVNDMKTLFVAPENIKQHIHTGAIKATTVLVALKENVKENKKNKDKTPEKVFAAIESTVKTAKAKGKTKVTKADLLEEEKKHNSISILKKIVFSKGVKNFRVEAVDAQEVFNFMKKAYLGLLSEKQFENFFFEKE